ncbi:MAG: hypothetical protein WAK45_05130, partial [Methanoregula sp.]|uniref:hypothetical protein n=1 Tax=Methanoregula sp. TaxID=2052170 RepID=UPI003BB19534
RGPLTHVMGCHARVIDEIAAFLGLPDLISDSFIRLFLILYRRKPPWCEEVDKPVLLLQNLQ